MKKFLTAAVIFAAILTGWAVQAKQHPAEFPFAGNSLIRVINAKTGKILTGKYENGVFTCTSLQISIKPKNIGKYSLAEMRFSVNSDDRFFLTVEVEKKDLAAENFYNGKS